MIISCRPITGTMAEFGNKQTNKNSFEASLFITAWFNTEKKM